MHALRARPTRTLLLLALLSLSLAPTTLPAPFVPPVAHAATIVVNTTRDDESNGCNVAWDISTGPPPVGSGCTLREAINKANSDSGPDTIVFNLSIDDPSYRTLSGGRAYWTIPISTTALPALTDTSGGTTINGDSPNTNPSGPDIEINGSAISNSINARGITISSSGNSVRGLAINGFGGNVGIGTGYGIRITGGGASNNTIIGNFVGTDTNGTVARPNSGAGVLVEGGASNNTIGGTDPGQQNIISGNGLNGVQLENADNNFVYNNRIGLGSDANPLPNGISSAGYGIVIGTGSSGNQVGREDNFRNFIAGNSGGGILVFGSGVDNNRIQGNYIGTNTLASGPVPNSTEGVQVASGATNTLIGGATANLRNVISGNGGAGIFVNGDGSDGTRILGNIIGLAVNGSTRIANGGDGILVNDGASDTDIGGALRNIISGNGGYGVQVSSTGASGLITGTALLSNTIGLNGAENLAVANTRGGLFVGAEVQGLSVGNGTLAGANVIAGNTGPAITLAGTNVTGNSVLSNTIGAPGLPNTSGISLTGNVSGTLIGDNTILGNSGPGISALDGTSNFTVTGNRIGLNADAALILIGAISPTIQANDIFTNTFDGIDLRGVQRGLVRNNLVRGNGARGIFLRENAGSGTSGLRVISNTVERNIGTAIALDGPATINNSILANALRLNSGVGGIALSNNANQNTQPPALDYVEFADNRFRVVGNVNNTGGCGGLTCTVELFDIFVAPPNTPDDEAFTLLRSVTVGPSGLFTVTLDREPRRIFASTTTATGDSSAFGEFQVFAGLAFAPSYTSTTLFLPGDVITYTHRLTNTGSVSDTFTLTRNSSANWGINVFPNRVSLRAGDAIDITTVLTVPLGGNANSVAGLIDVTTITATQSLTTATRATVSIRTQLGSAPRFAITSGQQQEVAAGDTARFRPTVTNTGNQTATVTFAATTAQPLWGVSVSPASVQLRPGQSFTFNVDVSVPRGTLAPLSGTIAVTVTPQIQGVAPVTNSNVVSLVTTPAVLINPDSAVENGTFGNQVVFRPTLFYGGNGPARLRIKTFSDDATYTVTIEGARVLPGGLIDFDGPDDSSEIQIRVFVPRTAIQRTDQVTTIQVVRSDNENIILDTAQYRVIVERGVPPPIFWLPLLLRN
jgi:CSLREA domain-containing protein